MIYLDYSATTPVDKDVLKSYDKTCLEYIGNPNSFHKLGVAANDLITAATNQIAGILKVHPDEIIYTSGASESNNLAIKGIALKYQNRGKHMITTMLEHSSIIAPMGYLQEQGYEVEFVNINDQGLVDLDHLKSLLRDDTILVSICGVDSEIGLRQPIEEIGELLKAYPKCFFHVDATQAIGKSRIDFSNVDLISISAHKFYGMKGFGLLIKKDKIMLEPLIHGGKSTTIYRSGTPAVPLIVSTAKALKQIDEKMDTIAPMLKALNAKIKTKLKTYDKVILNSTNNSIPHVINFSILDIKPETFVHALEEYEIYISTKSACSTADSISKAVYAVTKNEDAAFSTLRISLSYLTTEAEVEELLRCFDLCYQSLVG